MRILVLDTYYPAFLMAHYAAQPGLAEKPYKEQLRSLMDRCFGTSDVYSHHLRELGHEAVDVVANCEPLQRRWALEHGGGRLGLRGLGTSLPGPAGLLARRSLLRQIALEQIEEFAADVVYLQDLWFFKERELEALQRQDRLVAGQIASGLPSERILRRFDLLTTSFPHFVERFRALGLESEYLRIAFDERVLPRLQARGVAVDPRGMREHLVAFVGGLDPGIHGNGTRVLERAAEALEVDVWGYGAEKLRAGSPALTHYHGEAWGLDMYQVLAQSRIALNRHIDLAEGAANNMRLFEATGAGALLVTEAAANLSELFEPGREVVTYENENDLVEKLRHYVEHDEERRSIAAAGQARTLRDHTYAPRMAELARMLEARLP